ncbi:hypothetical protein TNCV_4359641 [Trichonephila clavipes]|uniref:Uncharacterized protein n=1 Tax=Trichonephila clavipes TaxID=2585209 RepID=A0A8X6W9V4_TRICX|nr:hypothetical protein TNCV_4359641 [Trichonephila clavipes]
MLCQSDSKHDDRLRDHSKTNVLKAVGGGTLPHRNAMKRFHGIRTLNIREWYHWSCVSNNHPIFPRIPEPSFRRVLPNLSDRRRGAIVCSRGMINQHKTWSCKPRLIGENCNFVAVRVNDAPDENSD